MPQFLVVLNFVVMGYLIYYSINLFNLSSSKLNEHLEKNTARYKKEKLMIKRKEQTTSFLLLLEKIVFTIPIFKKDNINMDIYNYFERRLHIVINGVEIKAKNYYVFKCTLTLIYIIIILCISIFNLQKIFLLICYPAVNLMFDMVLRTIIKFNDQKIKEDFYGFYSEFYYCYKFEMNQNKPIATVAYRYYNRACPEMKILIKNIKVDSIVSGEADAIKNMKENYKIAEIQRLCTQLERLNKGLSLNGLEPFKNELDNIQKAKIEAKTKKRKEQIEIVTKIPLVIVFIIVLIYALSVM